jgi:hypothetical protein
MKENYDEQIDRTLRLLGSANPSPGMEDRILVSIAQARLTTKPQRFFGLPQLAFGMSAAVIASAIIVVGSVSHSRHMLPVAPGLHLPTAAQPGVGAASAAHVAAQPVTSLPQDRPRSVRKTVNGRAVISPDAKKQSGIAVPKMLPPQ